VARVSSSGPPAAEQAPEHLLGTPVGVDVGGVDKVAARLQVAVEQRGRGGFVRLAGEGHRAKAQLRDERAGPAEHPLVHTASPQACSSTAGQGQLSVSCPPGPDHPDTRAKPTQLCVIQYQPLATQAPTSQLLVEQLQRRRYRQLREPALPWKTWTRSTTSVSSSPSPLAGRRGPVGDRGHVTTLPADSHDAVAHLPPGCVEGEVAEQG